jgi:hypothetical protein
MDGLALNMEVTVDELERLLGQKEIEIFALKKHLQSTLLRITELEQKPEIQRPLTPQTKEK